MNKRKIHEMISGAKSYLQYTKNNLLARTFLYNRGPNMIPISVDRHQDDIVDRIIVVVNE